MRLWSIHPKYLDTKGLVALWREALLAQKVLSGNTKGYKHHPQLFRFKLHDHPMSAIGFYLQEVYIEAVKRQYRFDREKILVCDECSQILVTEGQLKYEAEHLLNKLKLRDPDSYKRIAEIGDFEPHPLFSVCPGGVEDWEILT
ncbi:MAG TPA: pyrimidine dimer DNA glycosylase/endonuclease V [Bacillaceae bacterium]